jgi:hypothetical protein
MRKVVIASTWICEQPHANCVFQNPRRSGLVGKGKHLDPYTLCILNFRTSVIMSPTIKLQVFNAALILVCHIG